MNDQSGNPGFHSRPGRPAQASRRRWLVTAGNAARPAGCPTRVSVVTRVGQQEQARRPPVLTAKHTDPHSVAGALAAADHTHSGAEQQARTAVIAPVAAAQNESSLSQVGNCEGFRARQISPPSRDATAYGVVGPGVTSPKSRSSGCRAGHAGYESFPSVLPGPTWLRR